MSNGRAITEVSIAEMIIPAEITSRSETRQAACAVAISAKVTGCERVRASLWIVAAKTLLSAPTQVGCTEETAGGEFTRPEEIGS